MYLDAWAFVGRVVQESPSTGTSVQALASEFVTNWTNVDFHKFVQELADIVDGLNITPNTELWKKAEAIWFTVVSLEVGFWPRIGEDKSNSKNKIQ